MPNGKAVTLTSLVVRAARDTATPEAQIAEALAAFYEDERRTLLDQVNNIERNVLGYGDAERPTTAQIRDWWRRSGRDCTCCRARMVEK